MLDQTKNEEKTISKIISLRWRVTLNPSKNKEKTINKIASLRTKNNTFGTTAIPSSE
jgi:hypothetical protein